MLFDFSAPQTKIIESINDTTSGENLEIRHSRTKRFFSSDEVQMLVPNPESVMWMVTGPTEWGI